MNDNIAAPYINKGAQPRIAILREQGVNGHIEMAAAFNKAGFEAQDVHMSDLIAGRVSLKTSKHWLLVVDSAMVTYWVRVKVGQKQFCLIKNYTRTLHHSLSVKIL